MPLFPPLRLTEAEYGRLPALARAIIDADQQMEASSEMLACPVLSFGLVTATARHLRHRRDLTAAAHRHWGRRAHIPTEAPP